MGRQRRLSALARRPGSRAFAPGLWPALGLVWAVACGDAPAPEVEQKQRELLRPPDVEKLRVEHETKTRIVTDDGELLESDEVVAGVRLPRGFTQRLALDHEWYYESSRVTFEQLDAYFQKRLFTANIERSPHTVRYEAAKPRDEPDAPFVTVRIGVSPSDRHQQEIYIRRADAEARRPILPEAQVQAEIEAARRVAE